MSNVAQPPTSDVEEQESQEKPEAKDPSLPNLLSSLYRLLKLARMYDGKNQVLTDGAEQVTTALADFCKSQRAVLADIIFANDTIFVNGVMVPMTRDVYERAMELAQLLQRAEISNLELAKHTKADDLVAFVQALARVLRDSSLKGGLRKATFGGVTTRWVRWRASLEAEAENVSRVVRTYATGVVLVRRFYAAYAAGKVEMPIVMPRVAARIVTHAEVEPPLLVALVAKRATNMDEATIAVNSAIVAALMARQITTDRMVLANLVISALLYDTGRRRLLGAKGGAAVLGQVQRPLTEAEQGRLAPSNAAATVALDGDSDAAFAHTFIAYEAHELRRASKLSSVYGTPRPPSILARILHIARSFSELMVPGPYAAAMGPYDAAEFLASRATDDNDRIYIKLLLGGLGVFPPGTTVELSTGEIGVVVRVPDLPVDFARPPVRLIFDRTGVALREPVDVDLAAPSSEIRTIVRTIDADSQQQKFMRSFVLAITREEEQRGRRPPPMAAPQPPAPLPPPPPAITLSEDSNSGAEDAATLVRRPPAKPVGAPPPPIPRPHPQDAVITSPPPPMARTHPEDIVATNRPPPIGRPHPADAVVTGRLPPIGRPHPADAHVTARQPPAQARANAAAERAERGERASESPPQTRERPSQVVPAGRPPPAPESSSFERSQAYEQPRRQAARPAMDQELEPARPSRRNPGRTALEERPQRRLDPRAEDDDSLPGLDASSDSQSGARPRPMAAAPQTAVHPILPPVQPAITYNREELPSDRSLPGVIWPSAMPSVTGPSPQAPVVARPPPPAAAPPPIVPAASQPMAPEPRARLDNDREKDREGSRFPPERQTSSRNRVVGGDRPAPIPRVDPRAEEDDGSIPNILVSREPATGSRPRPPLDPRPRVPREEPHLAAPAPTRRAEPAPAPARAPEPPAAPPPARAAEPPSAARAPLPPPARTPDPAPAQPEPRAAARALPKPKSDTAATVQRSWGHFAAELEASREMPEADEVGTEADILELPTAPVAETPGAPKRRHSNAATVARSWADYASDLRESMGKESVAEDVHDSSAPEAPAEEPTRRAEWGRDAVPKAPPTGVRQAQQPDEPTARKDWEKRGGRVTKITIPEDPTESPLTLADDDATREKGWGDDKPKRR
jgi:hypothetical protein